MSENDPRHLRQEANYLFVEANKLLHGAERVSMMERALILASEAELLEKRSRTIADSRVAMQKEDC